MKLGAYADRVKEMGRVMRECAQGTATGAQAVAGGLYSADAQIWSGLVRHPPPPPPPSHPPALPSRHCRPCCRQDGAG